MAADIGDLGLKTPRSRLEVNFLRLFNQTQQMASGKKPKDWTFTKRGRLLVLYGSETGTAEEIAERIGREARRRHFFTSVSCMNEISVQKLKGNEILRSLFQSGKISESGDVLQLLDGVVQEKQSESFESNDEDCVNRFYSMLPPLAVVFVAATAGQGDNPENMKTFFSALWKQRANKQLLHGVKYGVIGLGDSSYQKFNYSGKILNRLLHRLGGEPVLEIGLGDDQHDLGPDFIVDSWLKEFWEKIDSLHPLPDGLLVTGEKVLDPSSFKVTEISESSNRSNTKNFEFDDSVAATFTNPCLGTITKSRRVTSSDHFQDVRLIEFDVSGIEKRHQPGDVLVIQPKNISENVEEFLDVMKLDGSKLITVEPKYTKTIPPWLLPQPCTIRDCVERYFDIMSVPKRYFFELLSFFTSNEDEKEKFLEFCSSQGQQDLYDYCNRPKRSILEVLADFPTLSKNIPFEYLFDLIPAIKPRSYSIASSSLLQPGKAEILMAVVKYKTIMKRPRIGVCSNWLITLKEGSSVHLWIKSGTLEFPQPLNLPPVIMIGPGTGCAPFRSYIQERIALESVSNDCPLVMIFGCRNSKKDHFFREEWQEQCNNNQLELITAFSRDQEDKVYVQHRMRENWQRLWYLIHEKRALVYFAGNAKRVPIDVHEALQFVCEKALGDVSKAEQYMKNDLMKRYQTETWA